MPVENNLQQASCIHHTVRKITSLMNAYPSTPSDRDIVEVRKPQQIEFAISSCWLPPVPKPYMGGVLNECLGGSNVFPNAA